MPGQTQSELTRRWKKKNPDKVKAQKARALARKKAERRASDPTGELLYGPVEGVDTDPERTGIEEPLGFAAEARRHDDFRKLKMLHNWRIQASGKAAPGIDSEL